MSQDKNIHGKMLKERRGLPNAMEYVPRGGAVPSLSIIRSVKCSSVAAGVGYYFREGIK